MSFYSPRQYESFDGNYFSNRKEFREYDRLNFRLRQEILLRDDEIKRLQQKLEEFRKLQSRDSTKSSNISDSSNNTILLTQKLFDLRSQVNFETEKMKTQLTNQSMKHSQEISSIEKRFNKEILDLQQQLHRSEFSRLDQNLENESRPNMFMMNRIINENSHLQDENGPIRTINDIDISDPKRFNMNVFQDEIRYNEQRIQDLKKLIQKVQSDPSFSKSISTSFTTTSPSNPNSTEISLNESHNDLSSSSSLFVDDSASIQSLASEVEKTKTTCKNQVLKLRRELKSALKNLNVTKSKIHIAQNQSFLTDIEIAEVLQTQDKIKKNKEKKNILILTLDKLTQLNSNQKNELLLKLQKDNLLLKREIVRIDYTVYGKTGKYQIWRRMNDETLLKSSSLFV